MTQESGSVLRLSWLGHPRVELSGYQVRLETRKTTALLAFLSLSEFPQSREKLAALFWPDFDNTRAPANLRRSLASLNASVPGDWIDSSRDSLRLKSTPGLWVDILAVRRCVAELRTHHHSPDEPCTECLDTASNAIELFNGEFLEGFNLPDCPEFDNWQISQRESLKLEHSWLLERAARYFVAAGRWDDALRTAQQLLRRDKMHEPAHRLMMQVLASSGQRSAAIRQYEEYAEALQEEFGQEPEEETRRLYNRVLSREVGPGTSDIERSRAQGAVPAAQSESEYPKIYDAQEASREAFAALVGTKLSVPPMRQGLVKRERLIRMIREGLSTGFVLVSAPAGFGKTTILTNLAERAKVSIAWLALDDGDNDVQRFLLHLCGSFAKIDDGVPERANLMLQANPPAPAELVVTSLINALLSRKKETILVLDDFHSIHKPEVHSVMRFLIDHRPPPLKIVLSTRADPPLSLARLRSQMRVAEVRAQDLRFTNKEAKTFFGQTMSLTLTNDQISVLEHRTEGWAAGLQMAALSIQGREDIDDFISSFGGTHHYVLDYLVEEVLARLPDELEEFLLDTSILEKMNAAVCGAVTLRSGCDYTLRELERMNLFVVPLDEHRTWYRYHHLFAGLLQHKLQHDRDKSHVAELHIRAGDWFAAEGELVEAIREYLAASAHERAADLIESKCYEIISRGALGELGRYCAAIPAEIIQKRPGYRLAAAWALAWAGRRTEAEAQLDRAEEYLAGESAGLGCPPSEEPDCVNAMWGTAAAIRSIVIDMTGETEKAVELARRAQVLLPPKNDMPKTVVLYILQKAYFYQGHTELAEKACEQFLSSCYDAGSIWSICAAVCELARLRSFQGRLGEAQTLIEEFHRLADARNARGIGPIAKSSSFLAEMKRERGELQDALKLAEQAVKDVEVWGLPSDVFFTHQYLARVLRSNGETDRALAEIEKTDALRRRNLVFTTLFSSLEADRVKILLARGDITAAEAWVRDYDPGKAADLVNRETELASLARVRLASGVRPENAAEVANLLEELSVSMRTGGRLGPLIGVLLLKAQLEHSLGAEGEALRSLDEAVRLGERGGYFRVFVEEGLPIAELLRRGRTKGRWNAPPFAQYVERLLSGFEA